MMKTLATSPIPDRARRGGRLLRPSARPAIGDRYTIDGQTFVLAEIRGCHGALSFILRDAAKRRVIVNATQQKG